MGWNLSRHGAKVVLIDAGQPGEGVTNWSFSWVNASNKTGRRSYFDLNVAGKAAYRELAETIGPDSWRHPSGRPRWVPTRHGCTDGNSSAAWSTEPLRPAPNAGPMEVSRRHGADLCGPDWVRRADSVR
ncbi:FAD-dependent oxidoreductase [Streptomyces canus]|uniref:FAD-dependent oxidoreductase n=1 Tax=Streptomyces canus TaxID=58343 RepID=UPI00216AF90F|nr:FAD-dependent oxidoreductase [Streptomyces canus]